MKKTNSIRRTAPARRRIEPGPVDTMDDMHEFEEGLYFGEDARAFRAILISLVALDTANQQRPSLTRSATIQSPAAVPSTTDGGFPRMWQTNGSSLRRFDSLHSRSDDHLPLQKTLPLRSSLMRETHMSTASLPYLEGSNQRPQTPPVQQISSGARSRVVADLNEHYNSDEDIPETVIFDNVPISPVAQTHRFESPSSPRFGNPSGAGHRDTFSDQAASISNTQQSRQGLRPQSYHEFLLNDMDADTRQLTAQLNDHHTQQMAHAHETNSAFLYNQPKPIKSRSDRKLSAKNLVENLRPVIDYRVEALPISKEKEAILACTRPTHLPPKSKKEEKKHLKEYEKLMFGSFEAERKSQKRLSKEVTQKAKHLANSADTWTNQIIPHFATAIKDPRTRQLWWSGLPNRVRGRIWSICIGNALTVNEDTFRVALSKSLETEERLRKDSENDTDDNDPQLLTMESYTLLETSVSKTFVDLSIFQKGGPLHESLVQVLKAYLYYRQDVMVAYIEGVNYIAGLLLLYLPPMQTFITLVNVLNRALPLAIYTRDEPVLNRFVAIFLTRLSQSLPQLHKRLVTELQIPPLLYLEPMLVSLLTKQAPIDISSRIFDIYAFEGDAFLMQAIIGVFASLEHALYGTVEEVLSVLSGIDKEHTWEKNLREEDFIKKCRTSNW